MKLAAILVITFFGAIAGSSLLQPGSARPSSGDSAFCPANYQSASDENDWRKTGRTERS